MATTKPGVQKPHCEPWHSIIAFWTGVKSHSPPASPSTVTTCVPSSWNIHWMQESTGR